MRQRIQEFFNSLSQLKHIVQGVIIAICIMQAVQKDKTPLHRHHIRNLVWNQVRIVYAVCTNNNSIKTLRKME